MPTFYFDFRGGGADGDTVDEIGIEFDSLELAYLDAYRSMVRLGADMLLEQRDPSGLRIEIRGEDGTLLMSVPFREVFASRRPVAPPAPPIEQLQQAMATSRRLYAEVMVACRQARETVAETQLTLGRARTLTPFLRRQGW